MAAKYVDLRRYGSNMAYEKAAITSAASNFSLEVVVGGRDGVVLHGAMGEILAFLKIYPDEVPEPSDDDLFDDLI